MILQNDAWTDLLFRLPMLALLNLQYGLSLRKQLGWCLYHLLLYPSTPKETALLIALLSMFSFFKLHWPCWELFFFPLDLWPAWWMDWWSSWWVLADNGLDLTLVPQILFNCLQMNSFILSWFLVKFSISFAGWSRRYLSKHPDALRRFWD